MMEGPRLNLSVVPMFWKVEHKKPTRELGNKMQMAQKKAGPDDITRRGPDKVQLCM